MLRTILLGTVALCSTGALHAVDLQITTLEAKETFHIINASMICDGQNIGSNLLFFQGGAQIQLPFKSVTSLTMGQSEAGFNIQTKDGKETTGNRMYCSLYQWIGENEYGGSISIRGDKWDVVKVLD
ncbi:hypothetical protein WCX49_06920 [Sulfurimonas sp. HSL-1656]|uniref:hypothetical protein n=1 Tax=Thiomicrolovo subterrani TaxID=3131934 RepID=UPI0031FA29A2